MQDRKTMFSSSAPGSMLLLGVLASNVFISTAVAQSVHGQGTPSVAQAAAHSQVQKVSPYHPASIPNSAKGYYQSVWGIDNMLVRRTASGNLIRFSYRVTDPARAKALGDKHATPYLLGQRRHAVFHIPVMEKVGQLRQTGTAEAGKEYWMVFSNKGNLVRAGDRVNVIIGSFHADGVMVE